MDTERVDELGWRDRPSLEPQAGFRIPA